MKSVYILFIFFLPLRISAQGNDSSVCRCEFNMRMNYPALAEKNNISGTVIVEMDRDSSCILSNPKVVKSLGYGCDEEALNVTIRFIKAQNICTLKCQRTNCVAGKVKQVITFCPQEEP